MGLGTREQTGKVPQRSQGRSNKVQVVFMAEIHPGGASTPGATAPSACDEPSGTPQPESPRAG